MPLVRGLDTAASQGGLDFATLAGNLRRKRVANVSRRFRQVVQGTYDIVIGNPPYVRPHRLSWDEETLRSYEEVAEGQVDLYIPFLYRAIRGWVKPGGRVSFIVPMGVLEASYAGPLRRVLAEFRLVEVVDLEALRKKTFRGIKRPTIIFVLENSPGTENDEVVTTTLSMNSYDTDSDTIDFGKADKGRVTRKLMSESAYLPENDGSPWMTDVVEEGAAALVTKVSSADAAVLGRLARSPRLGSIVKVVYKQRSQREAGSAQANAAEQIPSGANPADWESYVMLAYGIKLGSGRAIVSTGLPIYKGQNIFPSGVLGDPMGHWDPDRSIVDSLRLYAYRHLFDYSKLYAVRNVSQLPSACPAPADRVFQNTAQLVQLSEDFPLNLYLLSRIPQWFAIKLLRTSIIEDLFTTWVKRNLLLIPIPPRRAVANITRLRVAGELLVAKDQDLANAHRHVEELIVNSPKKSLFELFAENSLLVAGADLTGAGDVVPPIREDGEYLLSDELFFKMRVPNISLRRFLAYQINRLEEESEDVSLDLELLGNLEVPVNIDPVVRAINEMRSADPAHSFEEAHLALDKVVADLFGMSQQDLNYITSAMTNDGFLKQLHFPFEHRGLRIQPYADHSQGDRYI